MARLVILALLVTLAVAALAAPAEENEDQDLAVVGEGQDVERSITCGPIANIVGNKACAAHCRRHKKSGGRCTKGVCVCNKK